MDVDNNKDELKILLNLIRYIADLVQNADGNAVYALTMKSVSQVTVDVYGAKSSNPEGNTFKDCLNLSSIREKVKAGEGDIGEAVAFMIAQGYSQEEIDSIVQDFIKRREEELGRPLNDIERAAITSQVGSVYQTFTNTAKSKVQRPETEKAYGTAWENGIKPSITNGLDIGNPWDDKVSDEQKELFKSYNTGERKYTNSAELNYLLDEIDANYCTPGMSNEERAVVMMEYIMQNTEYHYSGDYLYSESNNLGITAGYSNGSYEGDAVARTASLLGDKGMGACENYSIAAAAVLNYCGFDAYAVENTSNGHAYTVIKNPETGKAALVDLQMGDSDAHSASVGYAKGDFYDKRFLVEAEKNAWGTYDFGRGYYTSTYGTNKGYGDSDDYNHMLGKERDDLFA